MCGSVSAQFLKIIKFVRWEKTWITPSWLSMDLSNGEKLRIVNAQPKPYAQRELGFAHMEDITTNMQFSKNYPVGTIIYKSGYSYNVVSLKKVGVYTIKKVFVRTVKAEFEADLNGDFSYRAFAAGIIYNPRANGSVSGKLKGGESTVVNVIFTNQKSITIKAAEDPIWLEAQEGQKVEHYKLGPADIYKLLF